MNEVAFVVIIVKSNVLFKLHCLFVCLFVCFFSAGCCITSDTLVERDKDYTGNILKEKASLVLRIAPTFLRYKSLNCHID